MPKISESEFKKLLNGNDFGTIYYICGTEKMFVSHYTKKLTEKLAGKNPSDFNFHTFTNSFNVDEFAAVPQTPLPKGISMQAGLPWKGPSTRVFPSAR